MGRYRAMYNEVNADKNLQRRKAKRLVKKQYDINRRKQIRQIRVEVERSYSHWFQSVQTLIRSLIKKYL